MKILRQVKVVLLCALVFALTVMTEIEAEAYMLPDTGQTLCYEYDDSGGVLPSCGTSGEDGQYTINPMSYTDNSNGTVTDNNADLMWQKCSAGQTNDSSCSGSATSYSWSQASGTVCSDLTLGGYTDWRLPSKKDLISIVDYSIQAPAPAIQATYFPNTAAHWYWTSTIDPSDSQYIAVVEFNGGLVYSIGTISHPVYVRCVRSVETAQSYTDNGDNTVTDNRTGLTWQKLEWQALSWGAALSYCADNHMRLPNIKELESLSDDTRYSPAIDPLFTQAHAAEYWSSTTDADYHNLARTVNFSKGYVEDRSGPNGAINKKINNNYIRCVRGGINVCPEHVATISGTTNYYSTIQSAYLAAHVADSILVQAMFITENLSFDRSNIPVALKGGYNCNTYDHSFGIKSGYTTLLGSLTISHGTVTVENLIIK